MRMVGIVAEYDPFHSGHAWHLSEARRLSGADALVVVMSGFFTQRGEPAVISPFVRAECAVRGGADLVVLLPACWSLRAADDFALGALHILQGIGVDGISFGAETPDTALLRETLELMDSPVVTQGLHRHLDAGLGWAAAMEAALSEISKAHAALLHQPNNVLGLSYMRAARRLGFIPAWFPVQRQGEHHGTMADSGFASASAIREVLRGGMFGGLDSLMPAESAAAVIHEAQAGRLVQPNSLDQAMLARLRLMTDREWASLADSSEGIQHAVKRAAMASVTTEEIVSHVSGKRYPRARIRRLLWQAALGMNEAILLPKGVIVLAAKKSCLSLLGQATPSFTLYTRSRDYPTDEPWFQIETRADSLWTLAAGLPAASLMTHKLAVIDG